MEWYEKQYSPGDYLEHHGVLGMKWGHHKAKVAAKKERKRREQEKINRTAKGLESTKIYKRNSITRKRKEIKVSDSDRKKAAKYILKNKRLTPEEALHAAVLDSKLSRQQNIAITSAAVTTLASSYVTAKLLSRGILGQ